jgi:hypothetical protein
MKKYFILFFILFFSLTHAYAAIEDNSIIDELEKQEIKQIDFDFNLKSFKSCENLENVM